MERENLMPRGSVKWAVPRETRNTDTGHRGRTARSRVEGAVMALDRRGCGVQPWRTANR